MNVSRGFVAATLLLGLLQACGPTHTDAAAAGGSGPGGPGSSGTSNGGGAQPSAGTGSAGAGGSSLGPQGSADKLDVLFVVDNSMSMGEKQRVLAGSVPRFVARLTNPLCVDAAGAATAPQPAGPAASCSSGSREFKPLSDIHFGVITTSLGSHGGDICGKAGDRHLDDQAQLLPSKRTGVASYQGSGFLAFDASGKAGVSDPAAVATDLSAMIVAAGEDGCGYEAPLEAMYRFLVDPEPPLSVEVVDLHSAPVGINDTLLAQRKAFLRPDSSLAIVIFSDENDCSIIDSGQGWFVASARTPEGSSVVHMPRASSACETNPNDACCRSCANSEGTPPAGCSALALDPVCSVVSAGQSYASYDALADSVNLRCFEQQRRFGFDVLQPLLRYSQALSNPRIPNRAGTLVDNPLFAARDGKGARSPTLVSVSVVVGAPWQDLASNDSSNSASLEYLDSTGLERNGRWPLLIGDEPANVPPGDPLMIESIAPRTGQNPLTMLAVAPPTSSNPQQNPINGHEKNSPEQWDLQHACIFPLATPVTCQADSLGCDCAPTSNGDLSSVIQENSALCQPPGGGPSGATQYFAKAYPGTRELSFARLLGERAVPASLCPKNSNDAASPQYGYAPAFDGLLKRIAKTID